MASPETPNPTDWHDLITWGLVFGGWFAVHKATLSRERRKEKRDAARLILEDLAKLERKAIEFHSASEFNPLHAADLRKETERLIKRIQRNPLSELQIPLARLIRVRKSITLKNIDASDFAAQDPSSSLINDIRCATDDLLACVENARETYWQ